MGKSVCFIPFEALYSCSETNRPAAFAACIQMSSVDFDICIVEKTTISAKQAQKVTLLATYVLLIWY